MWSLKEIKAWYPRIRLDDGRFSGFFWMCRLRAREENGKISVHAEDNLLTPYFPRGGIVPCVIMIVILWLVCGKEGFFLGMTYAFFFSLGASLIFWRMPTEAQERRQEKAREKEKEAKRQGARITTWHDLNLGDVNRFSR